MMYVMCFIFKLLTRIVESLLKLFVKRFYRVLDLANADARRSRYLFCSQRSLKIGAHDPLHAADARVAHEFPKVRLFLPFPKSPQGFNSDIQTNLIAVLETVGHRLRS